MAFHDVAEQHGVEIALQELDPQGRGQPLCFGTIALDQEVAKAPLDERSLVGAPAPARLRWLITSKP